MQMREASIGMFRTAKRSNGREWADRTKGFAELGFRALAALSDFAAVMLAAITSGGIYNVVTYGLQSPGESLLVIGAVLGALVVFSNVQRNEYILQRYATFSGHVSRCLYVWNIAFFCALALGFVTKTTDIFSRGAIAALYVSGLVSLGGARAVMTTLAQSMKLKGMLPQRRLFVVGFEGQLTNFVQRYDLTKSGMEIVSASILREDEAHLRDDLALAAATVRMLRPDDIFIAVPWSRTPVIEACVDTFLRTPAELHLGSEAILERFSEAEVAHLGPISSLNLTRRPLTVLQQAEKRIFDVAISSLALVMLAPLFAVVALLIRLDGPGPAFFLQRRYGFNQEPFQNRQISLDVDDGGRFKTGRRQTLRSRA